MKTKIAIVISLVCVGLLLFFLGRQSQPMVANANDSNRSTVKEDAKPSLKANKQAVPPAPVPRISKVVTTEKIERVATTVEVSRNMKRFLKRWERFSQELNDEQRKVLISALANTHDALILAQRTLEVAGARPLMKGEKPNGLEMYGQYVELIHAYAIEQFTFLSPGQRDRFKKTFTSTTFWLFGTMTPTIREMMGLESDSPFANADKREEFKKELLLHYGYPIE